MMFGRRGVWGLAAIWGLSWLSYAAPSIADVLSPGTQIPAEILMFPLVGAIPLLRWSIDELTGIRAPIPNIALMIGLGAAGLVVSLGATRLITGTYAPPPGISNIQRVYVLIAFVLWTVMSARGRHGGGRARATSLLLTWTFGLLCARILIMFGLTLSLPPAELAALWPFTTILQVSQAAASGTLLVLAALVGERVALLDEKARALAAERAAADADRLESLGRLAGGVAHDFNNVLAAIQASASMAEDDLHQPAVVREELTALRAAATRGQALTRRLLNYARRGEPTSELVDPRICVRDLTGMLRRLMDSRIAIDVVECQADVGAVRIDSSQLQQVIMNLSLNARDAMPNGGTVRVALERLRVSDARIARIVRNRRDGAPWYVRMRVSDTGVGIAADDLPHVFKPFVSTKDPDKGTGLGLATVQSIVHAAGGAITVESVVGVGTQIDVYLPSVVAPRTQTPPRGTPLARGTSGEHRIATSV